MKLNIALIGDFDEKVIAHKAIPLAIQLASDSSGLLFDYEWISTERVNLSSLINFDAIWCVPASPYKNMNGALLAIQFSRENKIPFLGTCGGYQHAVLEYARNVLGYSEAGNLEVNSDAEMPLITALSCKLIEKKDNIFLNPESIPALLYQKNNIEEEYHCSFGVNPEYLAIFKNSNLKFTGFNETGEPRVFELTGHPYYIGTAYQPEGSAFEGKAHPLIIGLLNAAKEKYA